MVQWMYPWLSGLAIGGVLLYQLWVLSCSWRGMRYRYAPTEMLVQEYGAYWPRSWWRVVHQGLRTSILLLLALAVGRPRSPLLHTKLPVQGVGIMLLLDGSRSMLCFDDVDDQTSRFEAARRAARAFIEQREHDSIGLVIFGALAATRCPLTTDHEMLLQLLEDTHVGLIDDSQTVLAEAIMMGVRRLRTGTMKEKIIVLLTDGDPSPEDRQKLPEAIALAQRVGVKIYAIGIGNPEGGFLHHPVMGMVRVPHRLQIELLAQIAACTGGKSFEARNPRELQEIYATIDRLERSDLEKPRYGSWYEWSILLLIISGLFMVVECGILWWHLIVS